MFPVRESVADAACGRHSESKSVFVRYRFFFLFFVGTSERRTTSTKSPRDFGATSRRLRRVVRHRAIGRLADRRRHEGSDERSVSGGRGREERPDASAKPISRRRRAVARRGEKRALACACDEVVVRASEERSPTPRDGHAGLLPGGAIDRSCEEIASGSGGSGRWSVREERSSPREGDER